MNIHDVKRVAVIAILAFGALIFFSFIYNKGREQAKAPLEFPGKGRVWQVKSVDTMKDSRDKAKVKLNDTSYDTEIFRQMDLISKTGATHVAVDTPYDGEFVPYLERWVAAARQNKLKVWFRGNFSSWEGWFGYEKNLGRAEHINLVKKFIESNAGLFEDGDIFTACPECENGGPGDPRFESDVEGFRNFMIDERAAMDGEFAKIGKTVKTNYTSMNLDVANLVFDSGTLNAMDNLIVVDHYTREPENFARNIQELENSTGAQIVLGEFGAPVANIHGRMDEDDQAEWAEKTLNLIAGETYVVGMNWWVGFSGSSAIFNNNGGKKAENVLEKFYKIHDLNIL